MESTTIRRKARVAAICLATAGTFLLAMSASAAPTADAPAAQAKTVHYIVLFDETKVGKADVESRAREKSLAHHGSLSHTYHILFRGFTADFDPRKLVPWRRSPT